MARKSALVVAGVNIAAEPPHSPNLYKDVITYIKNNKIIGIFGNERLEIESFSIDYENYIIDGTFSRYSYIDPKNLGGIQIEDKKYLMNKEILFLKLRKERAQTKKVFYFRLI